jgi:hypothetical protein
VTDFPDGRETPVQPTFQVDVPEPMSVVRDRLTDALVPFSRALSLDGPPTYRGEVRDDGFAITRNVRMTDRSFRVWARGRFLDSSDGTAVEVRVLPQFDTILLIPLVAALCAEYLLQHLVWNPPAQGVPWGGVILYGGLFVMMCVGVPLGYRSEVRIYRAGLEQMLLHPEPAPRPRESEFGGAEIELPSPRLVKRVNNLLLFLGILTAGYGGVLIAVGDRIAGVRWIGACLAALSLFIFAFWVRNVRQRRLPGEDRDLH